MTLVVTIACEYLHAFLMDTVCECIDGIGESYEKHPNGIFFLQTFMHLRTVIGPPEKIWTADGFFRRFLEWIEALDF